MTISVEKARDESSAPQTTIDQFYQADLELPSEDCGVEEIEQLDLAFEQALVFISRNEGENSNRLPGMLDVDPSRTRYIVNRLGELGYENLLD